MGVLPYTARHAGVFAHTTRAGVLDTLWMFLNKQQRCFVVYDLLRQPRNKHARAKEERTMPRVCVFDVIETMLDLGALDPHFQHIFGDAAARQEWFQQLLQSALVATLTNAYTDFGAVGKAALDMTAARRGVELGDEDRQQILGAIRQIPPHPDAQPGLERLRAAGFRLAALTNSTEDVARTQLNHAGLAGYFEQILSVDAVRRFKPAPEVYRMAAERLDVPIEGMRLVAAHAWDVAGAQAPGVPRRSSHDLARCLIRSQSVPTW